MLGKYSKNNVANSYDSIARAKGYAHYSMSTNTYNELRKILGDDIFEINRRYLDVKISEGKTFYFNVNPNDSANQTGDFLKELNYLRAKGYSFSTSINSDGFYYAIRN